LGGLEVKDHALVCSPGGNDILDLLPRHVVSECEVDNSAMARSITLAKQAQPSQVMM
jgi:hypothetical protein